jgi:hypothetical protein
VDTELATRMVKPTLGKSGPDATTQISLDGVEAGCFLSVPHAEVRPFVETRMDTIAEAPDVADALEGRGAV